jgi:hypothetical protein
MQMGDEHASPNVELPRPPPPSRAGRARYPNGDNPEVHGWKKFFMVVGIFVGFHLIVPGFFAIHRYGKWKRGEVPTPRLWMALGMLYLAFITFMIIGLGIAENTGGGI